MLKTTIPATKQPHNAKLSGRGILVVGGGIMQVPLILCAQAHNMHVCVMDRNPQAPGVQLVPQAQFIPASIGEREAARRALVNHLERGAHQAYKTIARNQPVEIGRISAHKAPTVQGTSSNTQGRLECAVTVGNDYTPTVAVLNATLKSLYANPIPGISVPPPTLSLSDARTASHKILMRNCLAAAGLAQPRYMALENMAAGSALKLVPQIEKQLSYPLVLKPADSMGSRGVKRIDNRASLTTSLQESLAFSRSNALILEEYLPGPELSIDAIVHNGEIFIRGIAERIIAYPPYFVETGHTLPPSNISAVQQQAACALFKQAILALGIENGAAKGDLRIYRGKAYIGEVAARLSGGYMSGWTTPLHLGCNLMQALLETSFGIKPSSLEAWEPAKRPIVCERALITEPGMVMDISGVANAANIQGVAALFIHIKKGDTVHKPQNNLMKAGNVLICAKTLAANEAIFKQVTQTVKFTIA